VLAWAVLLWSTAGSAPWVSTVRAAAQGGDPARVVSQKLDLLENLFRSPSAERIRESEDQDAQASLAAASGLAVEARTALTDGEVETAARLADDALKQVSRASRQARRAAPQRSVSLARYEELRGAIASYRDSLAKALSVQRGQTLMQYDIATLDADVAQAARLAADGYPRQANDVLARAYLNTVSALSELRRNETVVHTLVFDTPAAEFDYERERYRGNELLLRTMLEKGDVPGSTLRLVESYARKAREEQRAAAAQAAGQEYTHAIGTMESATRHLARALRALGVPIGP
jgi:DNA repair exonuclease SbcCD ATPase subunit